MILFIDNYDSFSYNLVALCKMVSKEEILVVKNDEISKDDFKKINPKKIIISPGPSSPQNSKISLYAIEFAEKNLVPTLGVCLGHQTLAYYFGYNVIKAPKPVHGKISKIKHNNSSIIFNNIPNEFLVTRYHSLVVEENNSKLLNFNAFSLKDNLIMALNHSTLPFFGVQFHPEAVCSEYGIDIVKNFIYNC